MKIFFVVALIAVIFVSFVIYKTFNNYESVVPELKIPDNNKSYVLKNTEKRRFIFIPYWTFGDTINDINQYDILFYFGITANNKGVDTSDPGYKKVSQFIQITPNDKKRILTLRLLNSSANADIIKDIKLQKKIIDDSSDIALANGYDGVLLDFEMNAIPFEKVINRISAFYERAGEGYHNNSLLFYITAYGDSFYRIRPYDLERIGKVSDGIVVMAYDFHKANGNPGPNFPYSGKNIYGYDFQTMISDFSKVIVKDKLYITYGLYGYDWQIDDKGKSVGRAKSHSLSKMEQDFVTNCRYTNCEVVTDKVSLEKKVSYTDNESLQHVVWFEDLESISKKTEFLKNVGINSIGYWAYTYYIVE